jgi:hypothetical protein
VTQHMCLFRVACQTDGASPLHIASEKGLVECVRTLVDWGAALNQAMVGYAHY